MAQEIKYPVYRKYKNEKSFFKIISETEFEEVKLETGNYTFHHFSVQILPDRNLIHDLTFDFKRHCDEIGEKEYLEVKAKCS